MIELPHKGPSLRLKYDIYYPVMNEFVQIVMNEFVRIG